MPDIHTASRANAKTHPLIVHVGIEISTPDVPNSVFVLQDLDQTGHVSATELDFQGRRQPILIILKLTGLDDLRFPEDPFDGIGIVKRDQPCPTQPGIHVPSVFDKVMMSKDRRQLAFINKNPGTNVSFRFAIFLVEGLLGTQIVAICDPRIIND